MERGLSESHHKTINLPRIFNDSIYGQIELDPLLMKVIDTPQFQRLRHLKQLGGTYLVYPGATHTRFEHSLGMAYLAGRMIDVLKEKQDDLGIDEKDILCVKIAALCYNLGHGPFSHLYEHFYREALKQEGYTGDTGGYGKRKQKDQSKTGKGLYWKEASFLMLKDILKNEELKEKLLLNNEDLTFIKELIDGVFTSNEKWPAKGRTQDKAFLYEIVINNWNGIDVHRWDYFARDCHHLGIPNSFDHQRLLKSARVCELNGRKHICFRDKVADSVYDMFKTQYALYSQAYQHKIAKIIEEKITEALTAAQDKLTKISPFTDCPSPDDGQKKRASGSQKRKIASDDERLAKLSKLTDHIFEEILYSTDVELEGARKKLEDVVRRRLPKCVGETRITEAEFNNKQLLQDEWNEAVDEWNKLHPTVFLEKKDFIVCVLQLDCSYSTGKNPFDSVYFYRKRNPTEVFKIKKYEVSSLMPEAFTEYVGRVYYTESSDEEEKDAKECFKWMGVEAASACPSLERCGIRQVLSCEVRRGVWQLYEGPGYSEPCHPLEQKRYRSPAEWGSTESSAPVLSLRHAEEATTVRLSSMN
ncbi:deoxynucleoside triphosphate triphosphohydrolase SAMHD1-like [Rhinichthys klamathensis goyatoka]|uniref:deoxynucleoside triphosphate triphosphohydrolase SAMHD1-like n=1 Tax=Rhinichthys klamathensis goyatoka TaxID=3034132 RepID=UPI0024B5E70A|nr:deoxynucleoside triphosphate triphosphohydrolase SAMHD1-like [Rhinichthys klamathensis goyatoka]